MKAIIVMLRMFTLVTACLFISACAPEVGSEKWCQQLKEKPKGEWTANELADYTKHCLF